MSHSFIIPLMISLTSKITKKYRGPETKLRYFSLEMYFSENKSLNYVSVVFLLESFLCCTKHHLHSEQSSEEGAQGFINKNETVDTKILQLISKIKEEY